MNLVLAPFPVDDQRCLRVARMLEKRLKQLEVQSTHSDDCWRWHHECAIAKIERLAQPDQEPVAWLERGKLTLIRGDAITYDNVPLPLYTAPPQPEQEPKPEPALSKKHLRIGDLWRKHDGK